MLAFTSIGYLVFLFAAAAGFRLCPKSGRAAFLLAVSYLFYLSYNPWAALLLAAATLVAFVTGRRIGQSRGAGRPTVAIMGVSILALVGVLAFYKLAPMVPAWSIVAPLGISYYLFKLISYVADIYLERREPAARLLPFAVYTAFFAQMVAGPIQRSGDFLDQWDGVEHSPSNGDTLSFSHVAAGLGRIAAGLFKKLVVADGIGYVVNTAYGADPSAQFPAWAIFVLFPMQLYADFSGLTDIAIGSGLLFGIRGPENFNRPFTATNFSDYWRRWHMSLTNWLGDYVFTPLRMATRDWGDVGLVLSVTVNMVLIGLWHGLTLPYVVFGLLNSVYMSVDALSTQARRKFFKKNPQWNTAGSWGGWVLTLSLMAVTFVFFRARSVGQATALLAQIGPSLLHFSTGLHQISDALHTRTFGFAVAGYALIELFERFRPCEAQWEQMAVYPRWIRWSCYSAAGVLGVLGLMLMLVYTSGVRSPFLYEVF